MNAITRVRENLKSHVVLVLFMITMLGWGLSPTRAASSQVLTVPAGAFQPRCSDIQYDSNGVRLMTLADGNHPGICAIAQYLAPIYLPPNATITGLALRARDSWGGNNSGQVLLKLRGARDTTYWELARVSTEETGKTAPGDVVSAKLINRIPVDNTVGYYLELDMRKPLNGKLESLLFYQAQIEYVVP